MSAAVHDTGGAPPSQGGEASHQAAREPAPQTVTRAPIAGLLPDHLRTDLRVTGSRARGERSFRDEPRHLVSEAGNVIFGRPGAGPVVTPSMGSRGQQPLAGERRADLAAPIGKSPGAAMRSRPAGAAGAAAPPPSRDVLSAPPNVDREAAYGQPLKAYKPRGSRNTHGRATHDMLSESHAVIFNHDIDGSRTVQPTNPAAADARGVVPAGGKRTNTLPHYAHAYQFSPRRSNGDPNQASISGAVIFNGTAPQRFPRDVHDFMTQRDGQTPAGVGEKWNADVETGAGAPARQKGAGACSAATSGSSQAVPVGDGGAAAAGGGAAAAAAGAAGRSAAAAGGAAACAASHPHTPYAAAQLAAAAATRVPPTKSFLDDTMPKRGAHPERTPAHGAAPTCSSPAADAGAVAVTDGLVGLPSRGTGAGTSLNPHGGVHAEVFDVGIEHRGARLANGEVKVAWEAAHKTDSVSAQVFEQPETKGAVLTEHPKYAGAAGLCSDSDAAQAHPSLPGVNGTPRAGGPPRGTSGRAVPGARTLDRSPPWQVDVGLNPRRSAPPIEYADHRCDTSLAERNRFRGVKKVQGAWAGGESHPREDGGIMNQSNFPEQAARRWDDQLFENRLKHQLTPSHALAGKGLRPAKGGRNAVRAKGTPKRAFK